MFLAVDGGLAFEGDMVLTKHRIDVALHGGNVDEDKSNGYALKKSTHYRWKDGIVPVVFHSSASKCLSGVVFASKCVSGVVFGIKEDNR